ncbi:MAG: hypothetical protein VKO39_03450 [Cyanobacteriota bacterium]|nr:hypothetical protein [Cyanobacteriota bacterium]
MKLTPKQKDLVSDLGKYAGPKTRLVGLALGIAFVIMPGLTAFAVAKAIANRRNELAGINWNLFLEAACEGAE